MRKLFTNIQNRPKYLIEARKISLNYILETLNNKQKYWLIWYASKKKKYLISKDGVLKIMRFMWLANLNLSLFFHLDVFLLFIIYYMFLSFLIFKLIFDLFKALPSAYQRWRGRGIPKSHKGQQSASDKLLRLAKLPQRPWNLARILDFAQRWRLCYYIKH